jgi:hypothetical protein
VFVFVVCIAATIISLRQARNALGRQRAQAVRAFLRRRVQAGQSGPEQGQAITA